MTSPTSLTTTTTLPPFSLQFKNILPLLPLITSTGTLTYAYAETLFLTPLTDEQRVPEPVIRTVWERTFYPGLSAILSFGVGSLVGGVAGYRMSMSKPGSVAGVLYASGTVLSMVHFGFVPWIAKTIEAMIDPTDEKPNRKRDNQKRWLELHFVRTCVSDIPAFIAFLGATTAYFLV
ncbi:hypothetical protein VTN00DRAFT_6104 [Thermoascus crustaceus]|uniref:uncharacterized protein n=1 Tax=Thermoascus crustaceus TaxID=5088 RepID=UPI0037424147